MHCDAEIGEQPSAANEEKHSYPERDNKRPSESLSFFDVSELSGQGDETGRNSEGIDDHKQGDERLQGELPEIFVYVRVDREEVRP